MKFQRGDRVKVVKYLPGLGGIDNYWHSPGSTGTVRSIAGDSVRQINVRLDNDPRPYDETLYGYEEHFELELVIPKFASAMEALKWLEEE